jgi:hypothetical protein
VRSQIDCLVNCCYLSIFLFIISAAGALEHLIRGRAIAVDGPLLWFLWFCLASLPLAYVFYICAVKSIPQWGGLVKAAFDCFLPNLAEQLGYQLPTTEFERVEFWTTLSQQMIYGREPDGKSPFQVGRWRTKPLKTEAVTLGGSELGEPNE